MSILYVVEQGTSLHHAGGRLRVERGGRVLWCAPLGAVDGALIFGNVQLSSSAIAALTARRAPVSFLSTRGKLKGRLMPEGHALLEIKLRHFARHSDEPFKLEIGRRIVEGKIGNARSVVLRWARNAGSETVIYSLRTVAAELRHWMCQARCAKSVARLLGVEGNAARLYFSALRLVCGEATFHERTRPAFDPINALLNLGYTLAGCEIEAALGAVGLDAVLGFYHVSRSKRAALAFDLLEEFRAPLVDRFVAAQWKLRAVQSSDFERASGGLRLTPQALKKFLRAYDAALNAPFKHARDGKSVTFRKLFLLQARHLADAVRHDDPTRYVPYRHR